MKIEQTSKSGISFSVELTEDERKNIKEDLEYHIDALCDVTSSNSTDQFLREIKNIL